MDIKNRWGIPKVTNMAHEKFLELAQKNLLESDIEKWSTESASRGYVAHNSPDNSWESIVGFVPDKVFYSQVTIGLAVDPKEQPDIFAKILICREKSSEFTKFVWRPSM